MYELLLLLLLHCAVEVVALKSRQPNPSRPSIYLTWMWRRTDIYSTWTYRRSQEIAAVERRYGAIEGHFGRWFRLVNDVLDGGRLSFGNVSLL